MTVRCILAAGLLSISSGVNAATMMPQDFDTVYFEGKRTLTLQGDSVGAAPNGDVVSFDLPGVQDGSVLLGGRVIKRNSAMVGLDGFNVTFGDQANYDVTFQINTSSRKGTTPFGATLSFADQSVSLAGTEEGILSYGFNNLDFSGQTVRFIVTEDTGILDYDISIQKINMATAPLPAGILLMFGALGGLSALRRRKSASA